MDRICLGRCLSYRRRNDVEKYWQLLENFPTKISVSDAAYLEGNWVVDHTALTNIRLFFEE